eukprot:221192_1
MDQIINFRAIIETFIKPEFELFCIKLYEQYDRRTLIIKSLFHLLLDEAKHNNRENVNKIYQISKSIMDLRRKKSKLITYESSSDNNSNDNIKPISIHHLASPLIANISSYLHLSEQTLLLQCNRFIFSSLTSSLSRIQLLDNPNWIYQYRENYGAQFMPYRWKNLNQFNRAKQVHLSHTLISSIGLKLPWNNLNKLHLSDFMLYTNSAFANDM